jgi:hypothetical protein
VTTSNDLLLKAVRIAARCKSSGSNEQDVKLALCTLGVDPALFDPVELETAGLLVRKRRQENIQRRLGAVNRLKAVMVMQARVQQVKEQRAKDDRIARAERDRASWNRAHPMKHWFGS